VSFGWKLWNKYFPLDNNVQSLSIKIKTFSSQVVKCRNQHIRLGDSNHWDVTNKAKYT
jgi:hypothetical protein